VSGTEEEDDGSLRGRGGEARKEGQTADWVRRMGCCSVLSGIRMAGRGIESVFPCARSVRISGTQVRVGVIGSLLHVKAFKIDMVYFHLKSKIF